MCPHQDGHRDGEDEADEEESDDDEVDGDDQEDEREEEEAEEEVVQLQLGQELARGAEPVPALKMNLSFMQFYVQFGYYKVFFQLYTHHSTCLVTSVKLYSRSCPLPLMASMIRLGRTIRVVSMCWS